MDIDKFYNCVRIIWLVLLVIVSLLTVFGEDIIKYQEQTNEIQQGIEAESRRSSHSHYLWPAMAGPCFIV